MDRFTRGFTAGLLAAIIQAAIGYTTYYLNLTELLWQNFAAVMIYGREPLLLGERIFAELAVWFFSGLMGIVFAYIIANINSRNHLFKGVIFAETIWFGTFAITLLFKVPEFTIITFKTSVVNFILSAIWGILTSEILRRLSENKVS